MSLLRTKPSCRVSLYLSDELINTIEDYKKYKWREMYKFQTEELDKKLWI
ncbi:MAG: hypothetical protein ACTSSN_09960 [Candidatus Heimdallarchaeaceae archaeon]